MKRFLLLAVLCLFSAPANATYYTVDLNTVTPIGQLSGPCYCDAHGPLWEIAANPGDVFNFGSVTLYSGHFGITPDGGPNQPGNLYYSPDVMVTYFSGIMGGGIISSTPDTHTWQLGPYTIPDNANHILIGWAGRGDYLAPAVPEPATWLMMLLGFASLGLFKMRHSPLFHSRSASYAV